MDATFEVTEAIVAQLANRTPIESPTETGQLLRTWGVQALLAQDEPGFEALATVGRWTVEDRIMLLEEAENLVAAHLSGQNWKKLLDNVGTE